MKAPKGQMLFELEIDEIAQIPEWLNIQGWGGWRAEDIFEGGMGLNPAQKGAIIPFQDWILDDKIGVYEAVSEEKEDKMPIFLQICSDQLRKSGHEPRIAQKMTPIQIVAKGKGSSFVQK